MQARPQVYIPKHRLNGAAKNGRHFDDSDFRHPLKKLFQLFPIEDFGQFVRLFFLLMLADTFNRWKLSKKDPTLYGFDYDGKKEEDFLIDLLWLICDNSYDEDLKNHLHSFLTGLDDKTSEEKVDALSIEKMTKSKIDILIMRTYKSLINNPFLIIDHISGFQENTPPIFRISVAQNGYRDVFVDSSHSTPSVPGYTSGVGTDYHRGSRLFKSLSEENQLEMMVKWYQIYEMLKNISVEDHTPFVPIDGIKTLFQKLIVNKERKQALRLASELYSSNITGLMILDDDALFAFLTDFNEERNLTTMWNSLTKEGKMRVNILLHINL